MNKYLIVVALIIFGVIGFWLLYSPEWSHDKNRKKLADKHVYEKVANILAQYCQCVDDKVGIYRCAYLPEIFHELGFASESSRGYISPDGAWMQIRGSLDPYGYYFAKARDDNNTWELSYFSESSGAIKLFTVSVDDIKPISREAIIEHGVGYFSKRMESDPSEALGYVMFLIDFMDYEKAIQICDEAIKALKVNGWFRLTRAFLISQTRKKEAIDEYREWIESKKSFMNYVHLYYFAKTLGEKELALTSIRMTLEQPLIADEHRNVYYYGMLMIKYSYEQNNTELALKVCDVMTDPLREKERNTSADSSSYDFNDLKNALMNNQKDKVETLLNQCSEFDLYEGCNVPWNNKKIKTQDGF